MEPPMSEPVASVQKPAASYAIIKIPWIAGYAIQTRPCHGAEPLFRHRRLKDEYGTCVAKFLYHGAVGSTRLAVLHGNGRGVDAPSFHFILVLDADGNSFKFTRSAFPIAFVRFLRNSSYFFSIIENFFHVFCQYQKSPE